LHLGFLFYRLFDIGFLTVGFLRSAFYLIPGCVEGVGVWAVWAVWGSRPLLTFDIPQTALVATLDTYDFIYLIVFSSFWVIL
jgi:hypothetical protein